MAWTNTLKLAEHPIISELTVGYFGDINQPLFYRVVKALREAQDQFPAGSADAAAAVWSTAVSYRSLLVDWLESHNTSVDKLAKYQKHFPKELVGKSKITFDVAGQTDELLMQVINGRGQILLEDL